MTINMPPKELVQHLAYGKARNVAANTSNAVIIGADTIVVFENQIFGKPKSKDEAFQILSKLKGKKHQILTGTSIIDADTGDHEEFVVRLDVTFRKYIDEDIHRYICSGEPMDKAGAYALQGRGSVLIEEICGDYMGGIGLSVKELYIRLPKFGIFPG